MSFELSAKTSAAWGPIRASSKKTPPPGNQDDYLATHPVSAQQRRVLWDLVVCRTAALGAHCRRCDTCGHEEIAYYSCRNRHCPKCQACKQAEWLDAQRAKLLKVTYYHGVFTLPEDLRLTGRAGSRRGTASSCPCRC